jgi:hypothetical protein
MVTGALSRYPSARLVLSTTRHVPCTLWLHEACVPSGSAPWLWAIGRVALATVGLGPGHATRRFQPIGTVLHSSPFLFLSA